MVQCVLYSMIEMMEDYTTELEERFSKKKRNAVKFLGDTIAVNVESVDAASSGELHANFIDRMAVMMLCLDSATVETDSSWSLVEVVRAAAMSVKRDVIVAEEERNLIVVATGLNTSTSAASPVAQLLAIAGEITTKVCIQ